MPTGAGTLTAGAGGFFRAGRHRLGTELTEAVSPVERDTVSRWKRAPGGQKDMAWQVIPAISPLFLMPLPAALWCQVLSWRSTSPNV